MGKIGLILFWCIIIIVMEKLKWEATRVLSYSSMIMLLVGSIGIIIGEYFKYSAVRAIRKIFTFFTKGE